MKAETSLLPTQPQTHLQGKHWRQCIFCQDYSLNQTELQKYYTLKQQANILFQNQERWDLLKILYTEYFDEPAKVSGKQWTMLGFQGQYPQTDFRGGGILSLQLIIRFVRKNKELVKIMQKDKSNFFFAITAINIAFFMKKYFHLADFLVPIKDQQTYCNRRALKNFCRVLDKDEQAYQAMHNMFLQHFYKKIWLQQQKKNTQTLLQFNKLFDELTSKIKATFQQSQINDFKQFKDTWISKIS